MIMVRRVGAGSSRRAWGWHRLADKWAARLRARFPAITVVRAGASTLVLAPGTRLTSADLVLQRAVVRKYASGRGPGTPQLRRTYQMTALSSRAGLAIFIPSQLAHLFEISEIFRGRSGLWVNLGGLSCTESSPEPGISPIIGRQDAPRNASAPRCALVPAYWAGDGAARRRDHCDPMGS
jgi:hypothetical protein